MEKSKGCGQKCPASNTAENYNSYHFSKRELLRYGAEGIVMLALLSFLFYRSAWAFVIGLLALYWWLRYHRRRCMHKRQKRLEKEFREAMQAVAGALYAGYSLENAWREAEKEMRVLYGENVDMVRELQWMNARIALGETLEQQLADFAERSGLEDVKNFYTVLRFAKRSGGDFLKVIQVTISRIGDKMEVYAQIETVMAAKQLEMRIMCLVPLGILLYIGIGSPGYLDVLYHNLIGVVIMSGCLAGYIGAVLLGERITAIEI